MSKIDIKQLENNVNDHLVSLVGDRCVPKYVIIVADDDGSFNAHTNMMPRHFAAYTARMLDALSNQTVN